MTIGIPVLGGVDLGGAGGRKGEEASSLVVDLVPPLANGAPATADQAKGLGLMQAIASVREQLLKGMNQKPQLVPDKVVITLKFMVEWTAGGTGQIKFVVLSAGGGVTITNQNASTIELTFARAPTGS